MAIVDGIIYPELHKRLYVHDSLTILIARDKELYNALIKDIRVLRAYLEDISINLQIKVSFADSIDKNTLGENLRKDDVDVALIDEGVFNDKDKISLIRYTQIVHTKEELMEEIGAFLVGNEIYWNFDSPVWHGILLSRYTSGQGITIKAQEFFDYMQNEKLSEKLTARARYLWAKTNLLSYSRDLLTYVLQLRRKTRRRGYNKHQNFNIEINYHLTNFYFLMASAFDIISRFLNEYYSLGINDFNKLALEKKTMLNRLKESVPDLYIFVSETENNKWISWLKRRRNYIAHDGGVGHAPLVKEKQVKLTDKEVSDIVDAQTDWESLAIILPQAVYDQYRQLAKEMVRLKNDYKVIAEDIMVVESKDGSEIFSPLISIHYDYDKFSQIVDNIMSIILHNPRAEKMSRKNHFRAMLLGLAIGDALGAPIEHGYTSDEIVARKEELRHMHDEAHFPRGVWTDDTSMALCLADSLLECGGYDSWNVMDKYCKWQSEGYRSYFDYGEGIGMQTLIMLDMYASGHAIFHKTMNRSDGAGNGVVMRLAPVVIAAYGKRDIRDVIRLAQVSARETHYSYEAEAAAEVFAAILHNAIHLKDKTDIIDVSKYSTGAHYDQLLNKLKERVETDKLKNKPGYVVYTLQIALWGFMNYDTFEDGMLAVMCLGGDVDTTMAVYGQLAGAYYGLNAIPNEWRRDVYQGNDIIELADKLAAMDDCPVLYTRFEEDVT